MNATPGFSEPAVRARRLPSGDAAYVVAMPADELPAVPMRALAAAWDAAHAVGAHAAGAHRADTRTAIRFEGGTDLVLTDRDARRWAAAVDRMGGARGGMHTVGGLALCVRLLALVELLGRAGWARAWWRDRRAPPPPALLRVAASVPLTAHGVFDDRCFRARLRDATPTVDRQEPP